MNARMDPHTESAYESHFKKPRLITDRCKTMSPEAVEECRRVSEKNYWAEGDGWSLEVVTVTSRSTLRARIGERRIAYSGTHESIATAYRWMLYGFDGTPENPAPGSLMSK